MEEVVVEIVAPLKAVSKKLQKKGGKVSAFFLQQNLLGNTVQNKQHLQNSF